MSRPGSRLQSSNLGSRVTARPRQLRTTRLASKRCKTKGLRDATRTHAHARRQYWIGYIQDTTARLTLAEQCRRLVGCLGEGVRLCNYNNTEKSMKLRFEKFHVQAVPVLGGLYTLHEQLSTFHGLRRTVNASI